MATNWVNFEALKQSVGIERVLEHYGVQLKQVQRGYLRGRCPLPGHSSAHSLESFAVNARKNIWAVIPIPAARLAMGKWVAIS